MTNDKRRFNRVLFESRRGALGLSLDRLARAADVSTSTAVSAAYGRIVGPDSRAKLAAALAVAPDELWPLETQERPE